LKRRYKYIITAAAIFLSVTTVIAADNTIDSLLNLLRRVPDADKVEIYNDISRAYWPVSLEESTGYAMRALDLAKMLGDQKGMADALNRLGNAEYLRNNYNEALAYYTRSLDIRTIIDDTYGILGSLNNMYLLHNVMGNRDEAVKYLKEALDLSISMEDEEQVAYYSNIMGHVYSELHDFEKAAVHFDRALGIFEKTGDETGLASVLLNKGSMYRRMSLYDEAQEKYFRALNSFLLTGNSNGVASVKNNMGIIHKQLNHLDIALEYFNRSLEIYNETGTNIGGVAHILNNIGIIWYEKEEYDTALDYYTRALESYQETDQIQGIATACHNIGILHTRMGNYQDAFDYYTRSVEINHVIGDNYRLANNYNNLGELFYLQKDFEMARKYLDEALEMAMPLNAKELISENYLFRSNLFNDMEDFELSLMYFEKYDAYQDSIYTDDAARRVAELKVRHEWENQLRELELLEKDHNIRQLRIERQQALLWALAIGAILTAVFMIVMLSLIRYRKKLNMAMNEKNLQLQSANSELRESEDNLKQLNSTKDKFFSIIAHDLKNPFNALLGFSETLNQDYDDLSSDQIFTYIDIINKSATNLYQLLENLLEWSKSQTGNIRYKPEKFELQPLADTVLSTLRANAERKKISVNTDIAEDITVFADKNIIATVIRNIVNNAVKFTHQNGEIIVSAVKDGKFVRVSVTDNGIGIDPLEQKKLFNINYNITTPGTNDEKGTGLGLILCKEFVERSGGSIWVDSEPGRGSKFIFTVPG